MRGLNTAWDTVHTVWDTVHTVCTVSAPRYTRWESSRNYPVENSRCAHTALTRCNSEGVEIKRQRDEL